MGRACVATIGAYDGVHLGHRAVIAEVRRRAAQRGCASVVVTFDRHPAEVVRPQSAPLLLTDLVQKLELLGSTGVDATLIVQRIRLERDAIAAYRHARVRAGAPEAHVKVPLVSADGALLLVLGVERTAPHVVAQLPCRRASA